MELNSSEVESSVNVAAAEPASTRRLNPATVGSLHVDGQGSGALELPAAATCAATNFKDSVPFRMYVSEDPVAQPCNQNYSVFT